MLAKSPWAAVGAVLLAACSSGVPEPEDRMVDVGGHRLHAVIAGSGVPAVAIDGGITAGCDEYRALQDVLAFHTTVVTYDRAGYGISEPGPMPRDSAEEAQELWALLRGLDVPPPYVLVGHSLGGLNAQVYAGRYAGDVAGMVLLDPPPLGWLAGERYVGLRTQAERMTEEWQLAADRGAGSDNPEGLSEAAFFAALASEHREMLGESCRAARAIETFGDIPLVVIASGVPNPLFGDDADGYQDYWIEESRALAAKSERAKFIVAERSTHRLHVDAGSLVIDAVLEVLERVGSRR